MYKTDYRSDVRDIIAFQKIGKHDKETVGCMIDEWTFKQHEKKKESEKEHTS